MNLLTPLTTKATQRLACDLCGREVEAACLGGVNVFLQTDPDNAVWRCPDCGLLFRLALPSCKSDEQKRAVMREKSLCYGEYTAGTDEVNPRMRARLARLDRLVQSNEKRLLDVGCGTGSLLKAAEMLDWYTVGTELAMNAEAMPRIYNVDIVETDLPGISKASFHVVHCNHVLEHVTSPTRLLRAMADYLMPGGYLCVEVPNEIASLASRLKRVLGVRYNGATAYLDHRVFFCRRTLKMAVGAAGLQIISVKTPFMGIGLPFWHRCFDHLQSAAGMGGAIEIVARKPMDDSAPASEFRILTPE